MMRRREMLMQMPGGSSIFDALLELVDSVTPTEAVPAITFNIGSNPEGAFIVVSDPPGNPTVAQSQSQQQQIVSMQCYFITNKTAPTIKNAYSLLARMTPLPETDYDYWGTGGTIGTGTLTTKVTSNNVFNYIPGYTYYLFKVKGS